MRYCYAIIIWIMSFPVAYAQQSGRGYEQPIHIPDRLLQHIQQHADDVQEKLNKRLNHYLHKIARQEQKLLRRLTKRDSLAVHALINKGFTSLQDPSLLPTAPVNAVYLPYQDTLQTSLLFLEQHPALLQVNGLQQQLQVSGGRLQALKTRLGQAESISNILRQRQQLLAEQLQGLGFTREIRQLQRQTYYYRQQINEYKELLQHPGKIERKVIDILSSSPLFRDFMRQHSQLAGLFRLPGNEPGSFSQVSYASLQTRSGVNELIQQQLAGGGPNAQQFIQQQMQAAQAALSQLKDKLNSGLGGATGDMPDFKPNSQKTKTFSQRLEWGANLQSQKATNYFPVTTDIGISLGYKLNDRSVIGMGASYKVGWGKGWGHIAVSQQGAGLRSFVDWKIKNSYWLSGGLETNYRPGLEENVLSPVPVRMLFTGPLWQQSGLLGFSKKYQAGKKITGKIQLLWDFLSYQQQPRSQPFVFRVGYDFRNKSLNR